MTKETGEVSKVERIWIHAMNDISNYANDFVDNLDMCPDTLTDHEEAVAAIKWLKAIKREILDAIHELEKI